MTLVVLPPGTLVQCGDVELILLDADKSARGLYGTVVARNGTDKWARVVFLADPRDRLAYGGELVRVQCVTAPGDGATALLQLLGVGETAWRVVTGQDGSQTAQDAPQEQGGADEEPGPGEPTALPEPDLLPLDQALPPPFPRAVLPPWLARWVAEEAEATQTPEDLAGCLGLAMISTALGGGVQVSIKPGWSEPLHIYTTVALESGERKSAVYADAVAPVHAWEAEVNERLAAQIAQRAGERRVLEKQIASAEQLAGTGEGDKATAARERAQTLRAELARTPEIVPLQRVTSDATGEAVSSLLAEQYGRLAVLSDEGGPIDVMAGRYSDGKPHFEVFLKGYSGTPVLVNRVGRQRERVLRPAMTVALCIQPEVLVDLRQIKGGRGRGLLARPLYCVPLRKVGYRDADPPAMRPQTRQAFEIMLHTLLNLVPEQQPEPQDVPFSPAARAALLDFSREIEPELRPEGALATIVDWGAKLVGNTARLAGLLHVAARVDDDDPAAWKRPISCDTVQDAIVLARYFLEHARIAFGFMRADPASAPAHYILAVYRRLGLESALSQRELLSRTARTHFPRSRDLDAPLALLIERGWLDALSPPRGASAAGGWAPPTRYRLSGAARALVDAQRGAADPTGTAQRGETGDQEGPSAASAAQVRQDSAALAHQRKTGDFGASAASAAGIASRAHDARMTRTREENLPHLPQNGPFAGPLPEENQVRQNPAALVPHLPHLPAATRATDGRDPWDELTEDGGP